MSCTTTCYEDNGVNTTIIIFIIG